MLGLLATVEADGDSGCLGRWHLSCWKQTGGRTPKNRWLSELLNTASHYVTAGEKRKGGRRDLGRAEGKQWQHHDSLLFGVQKINSPALKDVISFFFVVVVVSGGLRVAVLPLRWVFPGELSQKRTLSKTPQSSPTTLPFAREAPSSCLCKRSCPFFWGVPITSCLVCSLSWLSPWFFLMMSLPWCESLGYQCSATDRKHMINKLLFFLSSLSSYFFPQMRTPAAPNDTPPNTSSLSFLSLSFSAVSCRG